ncbi:MAG: TIM barrel protein [Rivularia sp. (in: cyanobacteria)]
MALEPLNPMEVTRYSTVVTIPQALSLIEGLPSTGLIFDTWNSWWEPQLYSYLDLARDKIACVQLADWKQPNDNPRNRTVPNEGVAPLHELLYQVEKLGYQGWYEVEIMSDQYQPQHYPNLLRACVRGANNLLTDY